jgi:hypothetical protein
MGQHAVFTVLDDEATLTAIYHSQNPLELILIQAATNTEHSKEGDFKRDKCG